MVLDFRKLPSPIRRFKRAWLRRLLESQLAFFIFCTRQVCFVQFFAYPAISNPLFWGTGKHVGYPSPSLPPVIQEVVDAAMAVHLDLLKAEYVGVVNAALETLEVLLDELGAYAFAQETVMSALTSALLIFLTSQVPALHWVWASMDKSCILPVFSVTEVLFSLLHSYRHLVNMTPAMIRKTRMVTST